MSRSTEQPSRWPKPPRSRPLALRPEDFDSSTPPLSPAGVSPGPSDLRRRMEAWATGVVERLAGLDIGAVTRDAERGPEHEPRHDASRERPARSPLVRFTVRGAAPDATRLVLALDATRVRAGLELPAAQARAARARLSDPARALELATALGALPEQFTMSASGDGIAAEAQRASADDVRALLDRVESGTEHP